MNIKPQFNKHLDIRALDNASKISPRDILSIGQEESVVSIKLLGRDPSGNHKVEQFTFSDETAAKQAHAYLSALSKNSGDAGFGFEPAQPKGPQGSASLIGDGRGFDMRG